MPPCEEEDLGVALDEDEGGSTAQLGVQMQTTGSVSMSGYGIFEPGIVTVSCFSTVSFLPMTIVEEEMYPGWAPDDDRSVAIEDDEFSAMGESPGPVISSEQPKKRAVNPKKLRESRLFFMIYQI